MGKILRLLSSLIYATLFAIAVAIAGIYAWFISQLLDDDIEVDTWVMAVCGLAGAVALYLLLVTIPTCCLGGKKIFSLCAVLFDILAMSAMIAIAIMTRNGADDCDGFVETPLGDGDEDELALSGEEDADFGFSSDEDLFDYNPDLDAACNLNRAVFILAIIGILLFFLSALLQLLLMRSHKKEQSYGATPAKSRGFAVPTWRRNRNVHRDVEVVETTPVTGVTDAAPIATTTVPNMNKESHVVRPSGDTAYTGGATNGYYAGPTGTGANAYNYENTTTGTTTNY